MDSGSLPKRVGIDARSLLRGPAGVATYVRNLLAHLPELDPIHGSFPSNNLIWNQLRVPLEQIRRGWKVFHAPSYTCPLISWCPCVLSVHDISYLMRQDWYPYRSGPIRRAFYRASLQGAQRIIVPSEFTRAGLERLAPRLAPKVRCVPLGVSDFFAYDEWLGETVRREFDLPTRFVLHVGDIHPRRNLDKLAEAASKVGLPLVLVGRVLTGGESFANWPYRFQSLSDEQLKGFYSAATLLVYPSEYEGFGLPLLEAMACGLPVVASNREFVSEVCQDAAVLVDPEVDGLVAGIKQILLDAREFIQRGMARSKVFSWRKTAELTRRVYAELA